MYDILGEVKKEGGNTSGSAVRDACLARLEIWKGAQRKKGK